MQGNKLGSLYTKIRLAPAIAAGLTKTLLDDARFKAGFRDKISEDPGKSVSNQDIRGKVLSGASDYYRQIDRAKSKTTANALNEDQIMCNAIADTLELYTLTEILRVPKFDGPSFQRGTGGAHALKILKLIVAQGKLCLSRRSLTMRIYCPMWEMF